MDDDAGRVDDPGDARAEESDQRADATDADEQPVDAAAGPAFGAGFAQGAAIREHWSDLIGDLEATAAEYRERGWEVLELHPGDVTVVDADVRGFDVLVPDDEFETLESWVADGRFDEHDVYLATRAIVFVLVVLRDEATERAVCCPLYYGPADIETLHDVLEAEGRLMTHVRSLDNEYVTVVHEDPAVFFPDTDS